MDPLLHLPRVIFDLGAIRMLGRELDLLQAKRPLGRV